MIDRALLKDNAKLCLGRYYWTAFAVSLVTGLLGGSIGVNTRYSFNSKVNIEDLEAFTAQLPENGFFQTLTEYLQQNMPSVAGIVVGIVGFTTLFALALKIFVANPIIVGAAHFYTASRENREEFGRIAYAFKNNYSKHVVTMLTRSLILGFYSLLPVLATILAVGLAAAAHDLVSVISYVLIAILPLTAILVVIKTYQLIFVPYILAENPNLNVISVMRLSKQITNGHKWDLFVLDLSFLGWRILGVLAFGIGLLFVNPYVEATFAEAYTMLKIEQQAAGNIPIETLPGYAPYRAAFVQPTAEQNDEA